MSLWRQLTRGMRVLTKRADADRDLADEVEHYLGEAAAAHEANGLSPEEAKRAARMELGSEIAVREDVRSHGWETMIDTLLADLRYGMRRLRGNPGFTILAVLTLAVGIGASTAIFSALNPILFEPLPYPDADRITMIWDVRTGGGRLEGTFGTLRELALRSRTFDAVAAMRTWQPTMIGPAEPERLNGQRVSASYFRILGVPPAFGRDFEAADDRLNGPKVVIISHALWQRRFGGDRAIVGRPITLNDDGWTVIGVMPRTFENVPAPAADVWSPLQYDMSLPPAWGHHLRLIGRLRPDAGIDRARRELAEIARTPIPEFPRMPWASLESGLTVTPLQDDVTRDVRPALLAVLGAVLLVLVIACVNVTNLLLARGAQRRGELAVRAALGAGRRRMIRQLLTESLLLAGIGGAAGMAVAAIGVRALVALSPPELPRVNAIDIDGSVFVFGFILTTLIGLLVGSLPARHAARESLRAGLQESSRRSAGGQRWTRNALVVAEVALALVLLVGAGLLLRSLQRLFAVAPGFDPKNLLTMQVQTSGHRFDDDAVTHRFFAEALEAVRRVPGVTAAAFTSQLPLSGDEDVYGVHFESSPTGPESEEGAFRYAVTPGYFETMRIPLLRGRLLDARDVAGAPIAVVIGESFAKSKFPNHDPIGQRVRVGPSDGPWMTIVGVVGDVKQQSLAVSRTDTLYITTGQWHFADSMLSLVVRTRGDAAAIQKAIWSVDKNQAIVRTATMEDLVAASAAQRRFALILFQAFALVALLLAATGIYGVLAGSVAERMRELGVRAALGASRAGILALVMRQGMKLTLIGLAIGAVASLAASRAIAALLFGISRVDPVTYAGVIAVLTAAAMLACALPAWRAARVDPATTLRAD